MDHSIKEGCWMDIFQELLVKDQLRDRRISDSWTHYLDGKSKLPTQLKKETSRWEQTQKHSLNAECWRDSCSAVEQFEGSSRKGIEPSMEDWTLSRLQADISGLTCLGIREISRYFSQGGGGYILFSARKKYCLIVVCVCVGYVVWLYYFCFSVYVTKRG